MFSKFFTLMLLVGISVALIDSAQGQQCSDPNQEYTTCGSACPPTCNSDDPRICTDQCIVGCQCKEGYMLNSRGECVPPENC